MNSNSKDKDSLWGEEVERREGGKKLYERESKQDWNYGKGRKSIRLINTSVPVFSRICSSCLLFPKESETEGERERLITLTLPRTTVPSSF